MKVITNYNNYAADHNSIRRKSAYKGLYTLAHLISGLCLVVIYVKYITSEGLLRNTLALDVDTMQEACLYTANSRLRHCVNGFGTCPSGTWFGQQLLS